MKRQLGITSVEFAVISTVLFTMLFGALEFGRLLYSFAMLAEGTRRAARLATVCQPGDAGITTTAAFAGLPNFTSSNVQVQYLDASGTPTSTSAATYGSINYVQVQIVGYSIPLAIPFINPTVTSPPFTVTLPRESLGVSPSGVATCS
jgi:Flp pilus assembly protein TadG